MTKEEAIEILRKHNEWRRYDGEVGKGPEMIDPKTLGEAIDTAIQELERDAPLAGYKQAEKDLALTWEDIQKIFQIDLELSDSKALFDKDYCEEVLRRFNEQRKK